MKDLAMKKTIAVILCATLTACATAPMGAQYRPVVDLKGKDSAQYEQDLQDCQAYASQVMGAGEQAAGGAAAGAIFGALLAAAAGNNYSRNRSALVGGLVGGAGGAAHGLEDQQNVIKTCLANRGYSVLH